MEAENQRGTIAFFTTYRPPVRLDIFSCPLQPTSSQDGELELRMTDSKSYNYSGQEIPPAALIKIFNHTSLAFRRNEDDVNSGRVSGMVFVSEREDLELLHIALRFNDVNPPRVEVYSLAQVFRRSPFHGVRMEDSGCFALNHLIYVSTKEPATERRQPWTAVYKTNLKSGQTDRLTPPGHADLSPSVSPSGKKIAVASFEGKGGWKGEIEDLRTDIYVMNVEEPYNRTKVVENGGWPTWGSDDVIFFHRKDDPIVRINNDKHPKDEFWGVYRANISNGLTSVTSRDRMTPTNIDGFTPAAIDANTVVVVTVRQESELGAACEEAQFRHIEIFDIARGPNRSTKITQNTRPKADHFNPFVMDSGKRIGYHRCTSDVLDNEEEIKRQFQTVKSPISDIGLFRVGGGFPTFSKDGSKLAFVDNDFKTVYVLDNGCLYVAYELTADNIFSPVWNQCDKEDTLYICKGPSFSAHENVDIYAIPNVSRRKRQTKQLTDGGSNNAFPSTNPEGTRLVYRSTRDGYKNLYIMENAKEGVVDGVEPTRLTNGDWIDTQCQWSPSGNWIVFSSNRDKPKDAPEKDHGLDSGYFAIYLVNPDDPSHVCIRVMTSGNDNIGGHVNHPFFSPDGLSIVVTSDLAGVSVDPISLPVFVHSARPYGDIFTIDIDPVDINKNNNVIDIDPDDINKKVNRFNRITHSRYENSTGTWASFSTLNTRAASCLLKDNEFTKACPCPNARR